MSNTSTNTTQAKDKDKAATGGKPTTTPGTTPPKVRRTFEGQFQAVGLPMSFAFGMSNPKNPGDAPKMIVNIVCEIVAGRMKGEVLGYTGVFNKDPGKEEQYRRTVQSCEDCGIHGPNDTAEFGKRQVLLTCAPRQDGSYGIQFISAMGLRTPMNEGQLSQLASEWGAYSKAGGSAGAGAASEVVLDADGNPIDF